MTKTKKLIALLVVLTMVMALVLTACNRAHECLDPCPECGLCTTDCEEAACADKCPGHGGGTTAHKCQHVCPTCQKCTDKDCKDAVCAAKCEGHQQQGGTHTCQHVCPTCQLCLDEECKDAACAAKCEGHGDEDAEKGTEENPYTVAELLTVGFALGSGNYSDSQVFVEGIIVGGVSKSGSTGAYMFYIADQKGVSTSDANKTVQVWYAESESVPYTNDKVLVCGYVQNYNGTKVETSVSKGGAGSEHYIADITRGTSSITKQESAGAHISLSAESGVNDTEFTFTVSVDQNYTLSSVKVNGVDVDPNGDSYTAKVQGDTTVAAVALEQKEGETQVDLDFVTGFGTTWATDWSNSYASKTVAGSLVGATGADVTIVFSNVSKQGSTISDKPVMAAKNNTVYVTVSVGAGQSITTAQFDLQQWSDSKKFSTLTIEYTTDNSTWTAVNGCGIVGGTNVLVSSYPTLTALELPQGVVAVRLAIATTQTSNQQVGITSATISVKNA